MKKREILSLSQVIFFWSDHCFSPPTSFFPVVGSQRLTKSLKNAPAWTRTFNLMNPSQIPYPQDYIAMLVWHSIISAVKEFRFAVDNFE